MGQLDAEVQVPFEQGGMECELHHQPYSWNLELTVLHQLHHHLRLCLCREQLSLSGDLCSFGFDLRPRESMVELRR